nr:hypothetical protein [Pseudomonas syringae pv. actinidiae]
MPCGHSRFTSKARRQAASLMRAFQAKAVYKGKSALTVRATA